MTTKKIVIIVAAVVITFSLLVLIFVGGIVGFALYSIGNSDAAETAKDFLRQSVHLKQDIGEIKDFGKLVTGSINVHSTEGDATLNLKVIGEQGTVNAAVELSYRSGQPWRVTAASYENEAGQTIDLFTVYEVQELTFLLVA